MKKNKITRIALVIVLVFFVVGSCYNIKEGFSFKSAVKKVTSKASSAVKSVANTSIGKRATAAANESLGDPANNGLTMGLSRKGNPTLGGPLGSGQRPSGATLKIGPGGTPTLGYNQARCQARCRKQYLSYTQPQIDCENNQCFHMDGTSASWGKMKIR